MSGWRNESGVSEVGRDGDLNSDSGRVEKLTGVDREFVVRTEEADVRARRKYERTSWYRVVASVTGWSWDSTKGCWSCFCPSVGAIGWVAVGSSLNPNSINFSNTRLSQAR